MSDAATEPAPELERDPDAPTRLTLDDMLATGVTYRRLDYWTRTGILSPDNALPGTGIQRRWTERDRDLVLLLLPLTAAGLSLERAEHMAVMAVDEGEYEVPIETPHGTVTLMWSHGPAPAPPTSCRWSQARGRWEREIRPGVSKEACGHTGHVRTNHPAREEPS